jgi:23S rRNA-intervening sequence protein
MFNFEKLEVWRKSIEFADLVYKLTRPFPVEERFGLTNQMRRASVAVSSNIAEGSTLFEDRLLPVHRISGRLALRSCISSTHRHQARIPEGRGFSATTRKRRRTEPNAKRIKVLPHERPRVTNLSTLNSQP